MKIKYTIGDQIEVIGLDSKNSLQELTENSDRIIYEMLVGLNGGIRREVV